MDKLVNFEMEEIRPNQRFSIRWDRKADEGYILKSVTTYMDMFYDQSAFQGLNATTNRKTTYFPKNWMFI